MGMAASQGRLLFMTARLSNNEFEQQCVAYSKQRLADSSQAANDEYLDALNQYSYQIMTGYNGTDATYEAVTYNILTGYFGNSQVPLSSGGVASQTTGVAAGKQYIVTDNKGQILVTNTIAEKFEEANGDYNKFLEKVAGLTQVKEDDVTQQAVHEAWDKYLVSIGKGINSENSLHAFGFAYGNEVARTASGTPSSEPDVDFATYQTSYLTTNSAPGADDDKLYLNIDTDTSTTPATDRFYVQNYEVVAMPYEDLTTGDIEYKPVYRTQKMHNEDEYVDLTQYFSGTFTYDSAIGEFTYNGSPAKYLSPVTGTFVDTSNPTEKDGYRTLITGSTPTTTTTDILFYEGTTKEQRELYDYAMAVSKQYASDPSSRLTYDANKVNYYQNIYNQMTTNGYTTYKEMLDTKYMPATEQDERVAYQNENWLITQLKRGKLNIAYYSATEKEFIQTTLDDDESICQKEDKKKIAIAEQVYNNKMDKLEAQDKQFDLTLNKLEAEHSALQTEYDAVAKIISKNVEKSFNVFNA